MNQSDRREHLVDTAIELFGRNGFHATGIDTILDRAGVSKRTLYRHFRTKEELILAALKKYDGIFRNGFMRRVEQAAGTPRERLLAVYDVAASWFEDDNFFGCMFINVIGEYSETDSPIRKVCCEFKDLMRRYIEDQCAELGADDPKTLASELALLLEGAIVTAQVSQRRREAADTAKLAASALIDRAAGKPSA